MSGRDLSIAETPDQLTAAWLTRALRSSGDPQRRRREPRGAQPDQHRTDVRLDASRDLYGVTAAPPTLVAKFPAADPTSRATAVSLRNYENEVRFYQELAPTLEIRTPAVYYADIELETAGFILLLEDMAPARQGDQLQGCDPEAAQLAIDELGKLHAPRWNDHSLTELEWLVKNPEESRQNMSMLLPLLWAGYLERYGDVINDDVRGAGTALFERLDDYLAPRPGPQAVVHGDYRLDNLLFGPPGSATPLAVVDWQTVSYGSPMNDVAYFLGAGLQIEDRREHEAGLVRRYHDRLVERGITDYDWDDCWIDYRRGTWSGLVMAVAASMLVERTERGDEMFLAMATRHARHALDLDAVGALG
ncbi:MAG: phosphotransferase [Ilumatobacteraceae bacterium]